MSIIDDILQGHPLKKDYEDEESGYVVYPSNLVMEAKQELADLRARTTWQPIETAPTDGTLVVLFFDPIVSIGFYDYGWTTHPHQVTVHPTLWLPLTLPEEK